MHALPQEILENILVHLDAPMLPSVMRVCSDWYSVGERLLYAETSLRFRSMLPRNYQDREVHRAMALDNSQSIAEAVRHLTIALDTFPTDQVASMFMSILKKTTRLISLDIQAPLHHVEPVLPQSDVTHFMPRLAALKANAVFVMLFAPGHSLEAIFIDGFLHREMFNQIAGTLDHASLRHLRVGFDVLNLDVAAENLQMVARTAPSIICLVIHFRLPTGTHVEWEALTTLVEHMCATSQSLDSIETLSLTTFPDAVLSPSLRQGQLGPGNHSSLFGMKTRELAEKVVERIPSVRRIDLRWHGWDIKGDIWTPVQQTELLRSPSIWSYTHARRGRQSRR